MSHDLEGMEEGQEQILTLKDARILDDAGMSFDTPCDTSDFIL